MLRVPLRNRRSSAPGFRAHPAIRKRRIRSLGANDQLVERSRRLKCAQLHTEVPEVEADRAYAAEGCEPQLCADDLRIAQFLDCEFDGVAGLAREFPLLIGAGNRDRRFVLEEEGRLVAHAAWRPLILRSGSERLLAAAIGLVTTRRTRRGLGYATRVVHHCLERAQEAGADLALLFAPPRNLYRRLGFVAAGRERLIRLEPGGAAAKLRRANAADAAELLRLLERHSLRVERTRADFETLLDVPGTHAYLREQDGRVRAYCVEGKGRDLRDVVHEWAGEPSEVECLLRALATELGRPLCVLSPESEPSPLEDPELLQSFALIRILRPQRFGGADPAEVFGDSRKPARVPIYVWGLDSV